MTDQEPTGKLHIDSDWKTEAAQEKERLSREEAAAPAPGAADSKTVSFVELINMIAMQAMVALGGFQGPGGESVPKNPAAAQHHIDILAILKEKTEGNLTDDEKRALDSVLYELRMVYVQAATGTAPPEEKKE